MKSLKINSVLIIALLVSSFYALSYVRVENKEHRTPIQSSIEPETQEIPDLESIRTFVYPSETDKNRIILYNSFENRDNAIMEIGEENLIYKFNHMPAITVKVIENADIPTFGLESIVNDKSFNSDQLTDAVENQATGGEINPLLITRDIIRIRNIQEKYGLNGENQTIAILDSGVMADVPGFKDENGDSRVETYEITALKDVGHSGIDRHGTHVAGIAAGNGDYWLDDKITSTNNTGMAPEAHIISVRVLDETGSGDNSWILEGIDYAIGTDASVISMSLSTNLYYGDNDLHRILIAQAIAQGKIVVAAAGNEGPIGGGVGIPGGLEDVIGVGAAFMEFGSIGDTWIASAVGPSVNAYSGADIIAPGNDIQSIRSENGGYLSLTGTSMATPHVSGGVLLLKQAFPTATVSQVREALLSSAIDIGRPVEVQGRGLIDFDVAYDILSDIVNNDTKYVPVIPNRIDDVNYYFRNRISGIEKSMPIYIHSHKNETITPHVNPNSFGVSFTLPATIDLVDGYTSFDLSVKVISNSIEFNYGQIYFTDSNGTVLPASNITYTSITRFHSGNILFDTSHDQDTPSGYFASSGPIGQFSKMSQILEERGYYVTEHSQGPLTSTVLQDIDLLIIADPDINKTYAEVEFAAIERFIQDQGRSLMVIADGGYLVAESLLYDSFNVDDLNRILENTGISINSMDAIVNCPFFNSIDRANSCTRDAVTGNNQNVLKRNIAFPNFGPSLSLDETVPGVEQVRDLAVQSYRGVNNPVIIGSELSSKGRVMVFSSQILFDNVGMINSYVGGSVVAENRQIVKDSISWLLEPRKTKVGYTFNNEKSVNDYKIDLYETYNIQIDVQDNNGNPLDMGDVLEVSVLYDDLQFLYAYNLTFTKSALGVYSRTHVFDGFGYYSLYFKAKAANIISSDGFIQLFASLKYAEHAEAIQVISSALFFLTVLSWVPWLRNEKKVKPEAQDE